MVIIANKLLSLAEKQKLIDDFCKEANKNAGKTIMGRINNNEDIMNQLIVKCIPTPSLCLNAAMGGGFPRGNITVITGKEDSGKTFIILESIGLKMKEDPSFTVAWLESENSLKLRHLEIFDIDKSRFTLIYHDRKSGGEKSLSEFESLIATGGIDMAVINSLKAIAPSEELQSDLGSNQVALQARLNSKFTRKITPIITQHNIALVITQHLSTMIGTYGSPQQMTGGLAIKYAAMIILDMRKIPFEKSGEPYTKEQAMKIKVTVKKNHLVVDRYPYCEIEYYAVYNKGIDRNQEIITLALNQGIIVKSGPFLKILDDDGNVLVRDKIKYQWQGVAKLKDFCDSHPDFFEELKNCVTGEYKDVSMDEVNVLPENIDELIDNMENK